MAKHQAQTGPRSSWWGDADYLALPLGPRLSEAWVHKGWLSVSPLQSAQWKALSSKLLSPKLSRQAGQAQCAKLCCQALQAQLARFVSPAQWSKFSAEAVHAQSSKFVSESWLCPSCLLESCCLLSCCLRSCSVASCSVPSCSW